MSDTRIESGLENVVVAETAISKIDSKNSQIILRGFNLEKIAQKYSFEEIAYLVLNGELPSTTQLEEFTLQLKKYRELAPATVNLLKEAATKKIPAIDALLMGVSTLSVHKLPDENELNSLIIAQIPIIVATYYRLLQEKSVLKSNADLNHVENFLYLCFAEQASAAQVRGLTTYLNTVIEHDLNASTFVARVIASTDSDPISCICGALGALKGPLHGGAPGPVLNMLFEIRDQKNYKAFLQAKLDRGERLMGFGHRVYRDKDPRAVILSREVKQFYEHSEAKEFHHLALEIEQLVLELLAKHKPNRALKTNVEYYTALLLHGIGINADLFTPIFAMSRVVGWLAHVTEQTETKRLIRPKSLYIGKLIS